MKTFSLAAALAVGVAGIAQAVPSYTLTGLGDLPGTSFFSQGYSINASGQVAGYSGAATSSRAFLWDPDTGMQDLGTLPGEGITARASASTTAGR